MDTRYYDALVSLIDTGYKQACMQKRYFRSEKRKIKKQFYSAKAKDILYYDISAGLKRCIDSAIVQAYCLFPDNRPRQKPNPKKKR